MISRFQGCSNLGRLRIASPPLLHLAASSQAMASPTQTAVHVTSFDQSIVKDNWANVQVASVPKPVPQPGEALVRLTTRPVNPSDLIRAAGRYGPQPHPFVNGGEGLGVIEASAGKFAAGQRVVSPAWGSSAGGRGTWQQFVAIAEDKLVPVPESLDDKTASQAFTNPVTVIGLLEAAAVPRGEWLLHSAAASVLGRMLVQYARHLGIKTVSIVRRPEHVQELKDIGGDDVIDSSSEDVAARVKEITGGAGAWAALDAVNGEFTGTVMQGVRDGGSVFVYGVLTGDKTTISTHDMRNGDKALRGFIMPKWLAKQGPGAGVQWLQEAVQLLADGVMTPLSGRTFPLDRVHEAIAAASAPGRGGKVFLVG